jgi:transcription initiation factor IIF auxiliary subunit
MQQQSATAQKAELETEKEDRKDERVKKQAIEQSKLISQRKGERPELTEEQEDDVMKILLGE